MGEINKMSDAKLRAALTQCGYKNMPITTTTRNIIMKKIKLGNHGGTNKAKMDHNISGIKHGQCKDKFNGDKNEDNIGRKSSRLDRSATHRDQASTSRVIYITTICDNANVRSPSDRDRSTTSSDDELRNALTQYGYEKIPITNTTRCTLMTKMKSLMINNKPETSGIVYNDSGDDEESNEDTTKGMDMKGYSKDLKTLNHGCTCKTEVIEDDSEMLSDCTEDDETYDDDDDDMTSDSESADDSDDCTSDSE